MNWKIISAIFEKDLKDSIRNMVVLSVIGIPVMLSIVTMAGFPPDVGQLLLPTWITVTVVMVAINVAPTLFSEEKEMRILDAILVSPASDIDVIAGKELLGIFMAVSASLLVLVLSNGFIGEIPALICIITLGSIGLTGLGLFIGIMSKSMISTSSIAVFATITLMFPAIIPHPPDIIQLMFKAIPSYYVINAISKVMFVGIGSTKLWIDLSALIIFDLVVLLGCVYALKMGRD